MLLPYLLICAFCIAIVLGIEMVLRRSEMREGIRFEKAEVESRKIIAIVVGFVLFVVLLLVTELSDNPVSSLWE